MGLLGAGEREPNHASACVCGRARGAGSERGQRGPAPPYLQPSAAASGSFAFSVVFSFFFF